MREITDPNKIQTLMSQTGFASQFSFPVVNYTRLYQVNKGEYILREGQPLNQLYYLITGQTKLRISSPNGTSTLLDFPQAPCFLGEMEFLGLRSETLEVRASTDCQLFGLSIEQCGQKLLADSHFLGNLCRYLGRKELMKSTALAKEHAYPLANRLAEFIIRMAVDDRYCQSNVDASEYLVVSYRHFQQVISSFANKGYLKKASGYWLIVNKQALNKLASVMTE